MSEFYTTGSWTPKPGEEKAFVEAWLQFADWARQQPGAGTLRLARDMDDGARFVSFGRWESIEEVHAWKASPGFQERMRRLQQHVAQFVPAELEVIAAVGDDATVGI
jgi:heme-degrading monooxygenase HmoA